MIRLVAVGASMLLLAACGGGGANSAGTCAAPYIDAQASVQPGAATPEPPMVAPGSTLTLYGHAYFADCYDTGQAGTPPPIESVGLIVELPGGKRTDLGTVEPDQNGAFSFTVDVPAGTEPGTGRIFDGMGGRGQEFTVSNG